MSLFGSLYFSYGSNMSPRQMARRCPGARPVGVAVLHDWRFQITTRGSANILPSRGDRVYGVLWRVELRHLHLLDQWEGVAHGHYQRKRVRVLVNGGAVERSAFTYASTHRVDGVPKPSYMESAILVGARAFGFPEEVIAELESWKSLRSIGAARRIYVGRRTRRRSKRKGLI